MSPPAIFAYHGEDANSRPEDVVPSVVVVDPHFENYKSLAESARLGKLNLHFRSSGAEALKLARRLNVDAWLVAPELEDISGGDFLELLRTQFGQARPAMVESTAGGVVAGEATRQQGQKAGVDGTLTPPITLGDLEKLLGLPAEERAVLLPHEKTATARALVSMPFGVTAAAVAVAVLMLG